MEKHANEVAAEIATARPGTAEPGDLQKHLTTEAAWHNHISQALTRVQETGGRDFVNLAGVKVLRYLRNSYEKEVRRGVSPADCAVDWSFKAFQMMVSYDSKRARCDGGPGLTEMFFAGEIPSACGCCCNQEADQTGKLSFRSTEC